MYFGVLLFIALQVIFFPMQYLTMSDYQQVTF